MKRNLGRDPTGIPTARVSRTWRAASTQARNVNGAFRLERRLCRRNSTRLSNTTEMSTFLEMNVQDCHCTTTGKSMFRVIAVMGTELDITSQVSIAMAVVRLERNRDMAVWIVTNMAGTSNVSKTKCVICSRLFLGSRRTFVRLFSGRNPDLRQGTVCEVSSREFIPMAVVRLGAKTLNFPDRTNIVRSWRT